MAKKLKPGVIENKNATAGVAYVVIPPDGGWGWVIVVASFICNFVAEGTMYSFGLFLPEIAKSLNTGITDVSLANSLMTGFYFFFGPIICAMINRWGYRIVGISGGTLAAIGFVASSFAFNVSILILSYGLVGGIGFGMLYMPSVIAIGFYFERWRGVANSVSLCGSAVGSIVMPVIILQVMKDLQWQNKFRCFAGFAFFCSMCTALYKPLQPIAISKEDDEKTSDDTDSYNAPHLTRLNKLNNQGFRRVSAAPTTSSFHSFRLPSTHSFKSYDSARRSIFGRSRMGSKTKGGCVAACCDKDNCKHTCRLLCCCFRKGWQTNPAKPMYRDDIFYTGSVAVLPEYQNTFTADPLEFHMSMTRVPTERDMEEDKRFCICCPEAIRRPLSTMFDFGMFKSAAFSFVALSGFLSMVGYYIPLTYVTAKALKKGMNEGVSGYLLSSFGFSHLLGRVVCAIITFFPSIPSLPVSVGCLFLAGSTTIVSVLLTQDYVQFGFCSAYGLSFALILSLRPIMIVTLFGLEKLSNSFGIIMMMYGMGCFVGIPVAGLLYNFTDDYDVPFLFGGGAVTLAGLILIPVPLMLKRERQKAMKKKREQLALKMKQRATTSKR